MNCCAIENYTDPMCGPCSIYERFPILRKLDRQRAKAQRELKQKAKPRR